MALTSAQRQARHRERLRRRGLSAVTVYAPPAAHAAIRQYARALALGAPPPPGVRGGS